MSTVGHVTLFTTADKLEDLIDEWSTEGYRVVSVCPYPGERRLIVVMAEDLTTGMADVIRQAAKDIIAALSSKGVKK